MNSVSVPLARELPLPNCYWVLPGRLLAGEYPGDLSDERTAARLQALQRAGITCCLDLTEVEEMPAYALALPAGVRHLRHPIPDHGVPQQRAQMAQLLHSLRTALAAGDNVYVHCRAGIGRTGTAIGCFLVEQGRSGSEAFEELNRLWQQNPRSAHWQGIPETTEQTDYILNWSSAASDPLLEPETLAAARTLRGRFVGTLLGQATGDALAAATQFRRPGRFASVGDLLGGGPFDLPRGAWSDDTAMALCLAESLLERARFDAHDQLQRYRRWQVEGHLSATGQCVGITAGTARALALAQWRKQSYSGSHDPQSQDPEVLARVAPCALYFFAAGVAPATQAAVDAARVTCQSSAALNACRTFAAVLHAALSGQTKDAILALARPQLAPLAAGEAATASAPAVLAAVMEVFGRTNNFREAVLAAANLGGNSDVAAAACGALAGAHYTASAIPALWRNSLSRHELLESMADRLLACALLELGS